MHIWVIFHSFIYFESGIQDHAEIRHIWPASWEDLAWNIKRHRPSKVVAAPKVVAGVRYYFDPDRPGGLSDTASM